jgi:hypothetical protein
MNSSLPGSWLAELAAPLSARFGEALTMRRLGNVVCWGYDGQSAIIELGSNGSMRATFVDSDQYELVSASPAIAAYRSNSTYGLTPSSCGRMVADLVDFFSGIREPKFTFIDTFPR